MKSSIKYLLIAIICLVLTSCTKIDTIHLPEPTPEPLPSPSVNLLKYYEPNTETSISAPTSIDELSKAIDMDVLAPSAPFTGMELRSIGYNGENEGALKYQNEAGDVVLYTFHSGIENVDISEYNIKTSISGFNINLYSENNKYSKAYWNKAGCTYKIFADPSLSEDDMFSAVKAMILVSKSRNDSSDLLSEGTLENIVGFPIVSPENLPEEYSFLRIYAMNCETAITVYETKKLNIYFAQCEGSVFPERIVTLELPKSEDITIGDIIVNTYRAENGCCIAEWQNNNYGYSITVTDKKNNLIDIKNKTMTELINCYMNIQ